MTIVMFTLILSFCLYTYLCFNSIQLIEIIYIKYEIVYSVKEDQLRPIKVYIESKFLKKFWSY